MTAATRRTRGGAGTRAGTAHRAPGGKRASTRFRIFLIAAALLTATAVTLGIELARATPPTPALSPQSMTVALTVNGDSVPVREFELFVDQDRAATFGYFKEHYQDADKAGFWTTPYGGQTPRQYLFKLAVADTVRTTVQQALGRTYALMPGGGYAAFLLAWTAENARRLQAVSEHQPIYGPVQYTEANYFTYLFDELTTNLQAALVKAKVITVTSAELHQFYLAHPGDFKESTNGPGLDAGTIGPVAAPSTAPFGQVKAQVQQEYVQQRYDGYITGLAGKASVHVDSATLAALSTD
jgi:hypothetical protein